MQITSSKIEKELGVQEKIEGTTDNIRLLRKLLENLKTANEWREFTTVGWHRYGNQSFETYRFWYVKDYVKPLLIV